MDGPSGCDDCLVLTNSRTAEICAILARLWDSVQDQSPGVLTISGEFYMPNVQTLVRLSLIVPVLAVSRSCSEIGRGKISCAMAMALDAPSTNSRKHH